MITRRMKWILGIAGLAGIPVVLFVLSTWMSNP
jgi:hypothetical protein